MRQARIPDAIRARAVQELRKRREHGSAQDLLHGVVVMPDMDPTPVPPEDYEGERQISEAPRQRSSEALHALMERYKLGLLSHSGQ